MDCRCRRVMRWCLLVLMFSFLTGCRGWWFWTPGDTVDNVGYHPEQPLPFDHSTHAGERKIPCQYCHYNARRSESAGVPAMNTCMGCHKVAGTALDAIKQLTEKYNNREPIEWVRVHDLPDFVRFTHRQHVQAGIECQTCHGAVEEMKTAVQKAPLQMGWCVSCHQDNNYAANKQPNMKGAEHEGVEHAQNASLECQACHY